MSVPTETQRPPQRSVPSRSASPTRTWSSCAVTIPFAISVFPDELYQAPRSLAERAYPDNLIYYNRLDRGGHFAAWEQPQLLSEELRAAFRSLR